MIYSLYGLRKQETSTLSCFLEYDMYPIVLFPCRTRNGGNSTIGFLFQGVDMKRKPIDVEELKRVFRINDKGKLEKLYYGKWKEIPVVSNHNHGYCRVRFLDRITWYHVVLWILYTGKDIPPNMVIDHINGNKLDNRIENLRMVNQRVNMQNTCKHRKGKVVGCSYHKCTKKYIVQIQIKSINIYLGAYSSLELAQKAYQLACKHSNEFTDKQSFKDMIKQKVYN